MKDVGSNNQTVDQSNDDLCKYAAYISIIVNIGTINATAYPNPPIIWGGAVNTVAAVAIVARPGTPPLPKPRINAMKDNVGNCPLGGRDVAKLTYSSISKVAFQ